MSNSTLDQATAFGRHVKRWRRQRGLSQLELAVRANVSQRHVSFIETGRSRPRANVVHRVAEALDVPYRDRNTLLEAAGLAPSHPEVPLSDEAAAPYRGAIRQMLESHEPYPAYVLNRWYDLVDANAAGRRLIPHKGDGPFNVVDDLLAPGSTRDIIENFPAVGWLGLRRLRKEVAESGSDERLGELLERAEGYMKDVPEPVEDSGSELVVCPHYRVGNQVIKTFAMVARFGTAREVTLDELRVELVFPLDEEAETFFRRSARS